MDVTAKIGTNFGLPTGHDSRTRLLAGFSRVGDRSKQNHRTFILPVFRRASMKVESSHSIFYRSFTAQRAVNSNKSIKSHIIFISTSSIIYCRQSAWAWGCNVYFWYLLRLRERKVALYIIIFIAHTLNHADRRERKVALYIMILIALYTWPRRPPTLANTLRHVAFKYIYPDA